METIKFQDFMDRSYVFELPTVSTREKMVELVLMVGVTVVAIKLVPLAVIPFYIGVMGQ